MHTCACGHAWSGMHANFQHHDVQACTRALCCCHGVACPNAHVGRAVKLFTIVVVNSFSYTGTYLVCAGV